MHLSKNHMNSCLLKAQIIEPFVPSWCYYLRGLWHFGEVELCWKRHDARSGLLLFMLIYLVHLLLALALVLAFGDVNSQFPAPAEVPDFAAMPTHQEGLQLF